MKPILCSGSCLVIDALSPEIQDLLHDMFLVDLLDENNDQVVAFTEDFTFQLTATDNGVVSH